LGLIGLGWLAYRCRPLLALTGGGFLTLFVFNLFYGIGDIAVYYIPLYLLWSLWIAAGVVALSTVLSGACATDLPPRPLLKLSSLRAPLCLLFSVLPGIIALHLLASHYAQIDQSRNQQARATWQGILAGEIPPNAILVTNDRDEMMPFWYMQYVEGVRPDLTGLFPLIRPEAAWADVGATTASALRSGRPVLLIKEMPGLEVKFRLEPAGSGLVRVSGPAAARAPQRPAAARFGDVIELIGYESEPALLSPAATMTVRLYWRPLQRLVRNYTTFVHLVNADGRVIGASDHPPGGVFYPTSLWKPDETLVDAHTFTVAADPGRPPYAVEVGLYRACLLYTS
ncbi:MAG: hypothetical protein N2439_17570, partial [Anaerolineae bacterium]|nr:hypothetical protein [Anaerolineae bacterium]